LIERRLGVEFAAMFKVSEIAVALSVSEATVYSLIEREELSCIRLTPKCIRVSEEQLSEFLESRTSEAASKTKAARRSPKSFSILGAAGYTR
jgi:excisionase family DNA binding protein